LNYGYFSLQNFVIPARTGPSGWQAGAHQPLFIAVL
jgi:hypothetical protein